MSWGSTAGGAGGFILGGRGWKAVRWLSEETLLTLVPAYLICKVGLKTLKISRK